LRKFIFTTFLITAVVFTIGAQSNQQQNPADIQKNLDLVDKAETVPDSLKAGFETITEESAVGLLTFIASDLLEGRNTTTQGYRIAAEYAASLFSQWGIKPAGDMPQVRRFRMGRSAQPPAKPKRSYYQEVVFRQTSDTSGSMTLNIRKNAMEKSKHYVAGVDYSMSSSGNESITAPVVFAGYGITEKAANWDDFKKLNVKDKIVLILSEAPGKDNPESPFVKDKELNKKFFPPARQAMMMRFRRGGGFSKIQEISKLGPAAILQVQNTGTDDQIYKQLATTRQRSDDRPAQPERIRLSIPGREFRMPPGGGATVITITRQMANAILENSGKRIDELKEAIDTNLKPASMELSGTRLTITSKANISLTKCYNVLGYIEGSDPKLKDEVIVIGAHYDHLGRNGMYIYNGADDNGSGSVGVLTAAKAFATNPVKPKRSVLFALWTGEEKGLLGSRYYVMNPYFPIEKTAMYFNMDMISRAYDEQSFSRMSRMFQFEGGDELLKKVSMKDFLTVNYTKGMDSIVRENNKFVGLHLYLREARQGMGGGGSDHASFASVNVPYVYTMAAMTEDYHQSSDSVEKISGNILTKACQLTYLVSFAAADK
jgi:hypothetical protein